jgi:hypothetical protein
MSFAYRLRELQSRLREDDRLISAAIPGLLDMLRHPLPATDDPEDADRQWVGPALGALEILGKLCPDPSYPGRGRLCVLRKSEDRSRLLESQEHIFNWATMYLRVAASHNEDQETVAIWMMIGKILRFITDDPGFRTPAAARFAMLWFLAKGHDDDTSAATELHMGRRDDVTRAVTLLVSQSSLQAMTYRTAAFATPTNFALHQAILEQSPHALIPAATSRIMEDDRDWDVTDLVEDVYLLCVFLSCDAFRFDEHLLDKETMHSMIHIFDDMVDQLSENAETRTAADEENAATIIHCTLFYLEAILRLSGSVHLIRGVAGNALWSLHRCSTWLQRPCRQDLPLQALDHRMVGPGLDRAHFISQDVVTPHLWIYEVFRSTNNYLWSVEHQGYAEVDLKIMTLLQRWRPIFITLGEEDSARRCHFSRVLALFFLFA